MQIQKAFKNIDLNKSTFLTITASPSEKNVACGKPFKNIDLNKSTFLTIPAFSQWKNCSLWQTLHHSWMTLSWVRNQWEERWCKPQLWRKLLWRWRDFDIELVLTRHPLNSTFHFSFVFPYSFVHFQIRHVFINKVLQGFLKLFSTMTDVWYLFAWIFTYSRKQGLRVSNLVFQNVLSWGIRPTLH